MEVGSPLTQGRGLKRVSDKDAVIGVAVAPHTGAWIETARVGAESVCDTSPLTQGRGLKRSYATLTSDRVAPHTGAWIETSSRGYRT